MAVLTAQQYEILERYSEGEVPPAIADAMGMRTVDVSRIIEDHTKRSRTTARKLIDQQPRPALAAAKKAQSPLTAPIVKPAKAPGFTVECSLCDWTPAQEYVTQPTADAALRMHHFSAHGKRAKSEPEPQEAKPATYHAECGRADCDWRMEGLPSDRAARVALSNHVSFHGRAEAAAAAKVTTYGNSTQSVDTAAMAEGAIVVPPLGATGSDLDSMDALHLAALDIPELRGRAMDLGNLAADLRSKVLDHRRTAAVREEIAQLEARLAELRAAVAA